MLDSDHRTAILRGQLAADVLRHETLKHACDELNQRAFALFMTSGDDSSGDAERERARRMVQGAESLLDILREWAAMGRAAQNQMDEDNA
jgi:hypothetical protein